MIDKLEVLCRKYIESYIYINLKNIDQHEFLEAVIEIIKEGATFEDTWELANRMHRPLWE